MCCLCSKRAKKICSRQMGKLQAKDKDKDKCKANVLKVVQAQGHPSPSTMTQICRQVQILSCCFMLCRRVVAVLCPQNRRTFVNSLLGICQEHALMTIYVYAVQKSLCSATKSVQCSKVCAVQESLYTRYFAKT